MFIPFVFSDHTIEAYDILVALLESELGQLLANLRATGIGANSPAYHQVTDNGELIPATTTSCNASTLSSPNLDLTSTSCSTSSSANALHQQQNQLQPTTTAQTSIISSCCTGNSSGNNNNSNDNSPTGELSRTSVVSSSSYNNNANRTTDHQHPLHESTSTTTTTTAALILATRTSTSITTTSASTPGFSGQEELDIRALIERANENRLTAENAARVLLTRFVADPSGLENTNCGSNTGSLLNLPVSDHHQQHHNNNHGRENHHHHHLCPPGQSVVPPLPLPWEETSSCSQTLR